MMTMTYRQIRLRFVGDFPAKMMPFMMAGIKYGSFQAKTSLGGLVPASSIQPKVARAPHGVGAFARDTGVLAQPAQRLSKFGVEIESINIDFAQQQ